MNERQLQSFILAADSKSFSKAASSSNISTTALIQQVNLLEEGIGFQLFERTHRGISLTPAGNSFYQAAKNILKIYETACTQGKELEKAKNASLKISYPYEQFPAFLLAAYEAFRNDFPGANIDFLPLPFNEHLSAISNGIADLSVIAEPSKTYLAGLHFYPLYDETYSFCMRPEHPLAATPLITMEQLNNVKIICGNYEYLKTPFTKQLSSSHATLLAIDKEYDMSIRTKSLMSDEILVIHSLWSQPYELFLKVIPSNIPAGKVGVVYRKPPSKAINSFLPYLKNIKKI